MRLVEVGEGYRQLELAEIIRGDDQYEDGAHNWTIVRGTANYDIGNPVVEDHVPFRRKVQRNMIITDKGSITYRRDDI